MPSVSTETLLPATAEEVWAKVGSVSGQAEWSTVRTVATELPETLEPGTTFTATIDSMGMSSEVVWTVVALEPERLLEMRGKGTLGITLSVRYALEPRADGTRLTVDMGFGGAMVKLMAGAVKATARRDMTASLERLADLLRAPAA
ncbi:SRPBCC family protein [Nocardia sp. 2]|uniref:SRPBCC family protein n=1 Tax=Nocardia acididurans TaxID=2802282 RepID=A0ABS1MFU1_9NOCA|nr:SRPBCC family protein [Nocardia acididurans]MBL1078915.1 SRPBCC family protein [Nocardia acididurans]